MNISVKILFLFTYLLVVSCSSDDSVKFEEPTQEHTSSKFTGIRYNSKYTIYTMQSPLTEALMENFSSVEIAYSEQLRSPGSSSISEAQKHEIRSRHDNNIHDITDVIITSDNTEIWIYVKIDPGKPGGISVGISADDDIECVRC